MLYYFNFYFLKKRQLKSLKVVKFESVKTYILTLRALILTFRQINAAKILIINFIYSVIRKIYNPNLKPAKTFKLGTFKLKTATMRYFLQ